MATAAPAIITRNTFTLTDKLKFQQRCIRERQYTRIGPLTTIVLERQLPTAGISQSKPRWQNAEQEKVFNRDKNFSPPFSEWQAANWVLLTLDWLTHTKAPRLAVSADRNDLLLPMGLTPLPSIPDPLWTPKKAGDIAPRVEQKLESRACGRIRDRISGKWFLVFQPLTELMVLCGKGQDSGFGRIKCVTDPATRLHPSLLINPDPMDRFGNLEAYFASGAFQAGY
jgi:hypothetical protein